jgi:hypothetical protein
LRARGVRCALKNFEQRWHSRAARICSPADTSATPLRHRRTLLPEELTPATPHHVWLAWPDQLRPKRSGGTRAVHGGQNSTTIGHNKQSMEGAGRHDLF